MPSPDFICIGAQKAGTSWLFNNLMQHPDICFAATPSGRPIKEVNFFGGHKRDVFGEYERDEAWYKSLFTPIPGQRSGDISPIYAISSLEKIYAAKRICPNATILYILRNPIDRLWSSIRMKMQIANDFSERQMWEIFDNIVHDGHGDYSANIARWRSVFGDQLHILQYDDLAGSPSEFYTKVCAIIGIDPNKHVEPHLLEKLIFEGPRLDAPVDIVRQMTDMYRSTILECRARFPNEYTAQWASIYES